MNRREPPEQFRASYFLQGPHTMLLDVLTDVPGAVQVLRVRKKRRDRTRHCSVGICDDYLRTAVGGWRCEDNIRNDGD